LGTSTGEVLSFQLFNTEKPEKTCGLKYRLLGVLCSPDGNPGPTTCQIQPFTHPYVEPGCMDCMCPTASCNALAKNTTPTSKVTGKLKQQ